MAGGAKEDQLAANAGRVAKVLGAIAAGVGVVGLVTVVGGAVSWIRFDALGIPADKAVAAIPSGELVSIGASTLIPYIALACAVVFLAYLFAADNLVPSDPATDVQARWAGAHTAPAPPAISTAGLPAATDSALSAVAKEALAARAIVIVESEKAAATSRLGDSDQTGVHAKNAHDAFAQLQQKVAQAAGSLGDAKIDPDKLVAEAKLARDATDASIAAAEAAKKSAGLRIVAASGLLLLLEMALVVAAGAPTIGDFALLVPLGLVLAYGTLQVGRRTRGFAFFGASLFIAVLLFGAARTLFRTREHPKLQPIAVLRTGPDSGMIGYYIAETDSNVYLARVEEMVLHGKSFNEALPRIVIVPRASVTAIAIGPLLERRRGLKDATLMLHELCEQKVPEASTATPAKANPCPPNSAAILGDSTTGPRPPKAARPGHPAAARKGKPKDS